MRITGGKYKGIHLRCPPGIIRPAMDRMRESLYAILGPLEGASFLDLFSGSGLMSLEAVSRGADRVHAVEKDRKKLKVLMENLKIAEKHCTIRSTSAESFIARHKEFYDYIFLDPPFSCSYKNDILQRLINSCLIKIGSIVLR
ncbi:MAG: RsmD family RNA methyltransferase, partial [Salinispira sp.]